MYVCMYVCCMYVCMLYVCMLYPCTGLIISVWNVMRVASSLDRNAKQQDDYGDGNISIGVYEYICV